MHRRIAALTWIVLLASVHPHRALAQTPAAPATCQSTATGDLRLHQVSSRIFGNTRTIRVLLPDGYGLPENRTKRYPVLYLLDGQNLFDACLSEVSHREWQVDETVRRLIAEHRLPPLIVVGIDHAGRDRAVEFLPYKDFFGNPNMGEPKGARFPEFLLTEILPLIDSAYRTMRGAQNTGIGGSSYGGVASLYALISAPQAFGYALIESASLFVGAGQLVRDTDPLVALPVRVFVAVGTEEIRDPRASALLVSLHRRLAANFHAAGYDSTRFRLVLDPAGKHSEDSWARRFPAAVAFLFGDWKEGSGPPR